MSFQPSQLWAPLGPPRHTDDTLLPLQKFTDSRESYYSPLTDTSGFMDALLYQINCDNWSCRKLHCFNWKQTILCISLNIEKNWPIVAYFLTFWKDYGITNSLKLTFQKIFIPIEVNFIFLLNLDYIIFVFHNAWFLAINFLILQDSIKPNASKRKLDKLNLYI